jgi:uncharacterized protein YsxB (DUF464 family)
MINIDFRIINNKVCVLKVEGHDSSAEKGSNLVCGAVSVLTQTFVVGMEQELKAKITGTLESGLCDIRVEVAEPNSSLLKRIFKVFELGFQKVEEAYPKQVRMIKVGEI